MSRHDDGVTLRQMLDRWEIVTADCQALAGQIKALVGGKP
jgi:hypothetical protein